MFALCGVSQILNGAIVQQTFVVDFVVTNQQCLDCQKSYTENTWTACKCCAEGTGKGKGERRASGDTFYDEKVLCA